ncbi:DUF4244 domain-containing protein [Nocardioides sp. GY 10127]|uniref:DUF4244 domain-containing protein n=1 Tax=Nocardioides sp. GY 10127 TaxID=2569762 RepID=UPI0010A8446E|nr:DUF4244 domain-containing protein [Nocardioides sp. GY 10127]TIC78577.1 DUF4244 domain-containing protein [Nocardioides sp. GY 10127]
MHQQTHVPHDPHRSTERPVRQPSDPQPSDRGRRRDDRGITTAEYAVGTAAGAGLAGLLYTLLTGGLGNRLLTTLFDHVLAQLGLG